MIFNNVGNVLKKNTKTRTWWIKLAIAIMVSNLFFFFLFSGNETTAATTAIPEGWVEIQIKGELLTTFQKGKKALLINRSYSKKVEVVLLERGELPDERHVVLVRENEAGILINHNEWEILPFIKTFELAAKVKGESHEIHY